jgi:hypothetical protein
MKLTAGNIYDAYYALNAIVNTKRVLPQTAKYRLARLYSALKKEYDLLETERVNLVKELGEPVKNEEGVETGWQVPPAKMEEYSKRWIEYRNQLLEVPVEPLYLSSLGDDPNGIEAKEFEMLGALIIEPPMPTLA